MSESFWSHVDKGPGCWLWTAYRNEHGYGRVRDGRRLVLAHRRAWELARGAVPLGLRVLHKCDVPACVNPDHLFVGTQLENMADRHAKGRDAVYYGEQHPRAQLTDDQAREVLRRSRAGETNKAIADSFGVHPNTVLFIKQGKAYAIATGLRPEPRNTFTAAQRKATMAKKKDAPTLEDLDLDLDIPTPPGAPEPGAAPAPPLDLEVAGVDPNEWGGDHVEDRSGVEAVKLTAAQIELLAVDPKGLEAVYVNLPAQIGLQGLKLARATAAFNVAKGAVKGVEAALDSIHRSRIVREGGKPTEGSVAGAVARDPRLTGARAKLAKLDEEREQEWAIMEGLRAKLSTSIAVGQLLRAELVNEPRINKPTP